MDGTAATVGAGEQPPRAGALLLVLCSAQFMIVLDVSVTNVALASIQRELGFGPAGLQWIVTAYTLTFGGLLILGGRAGDLFGRRRLFVLGLALFSAASLVCGLAVTPAMLVLARGIQGIGAAALAPAALSLLTANFAEGPARTRALGVWGAVAAVGGTAGLIVGGILTDTLGWRAVFFVNVPVGVALLVLTARVVNESREPTGDRLDLVGAVLITAGLGAGVFALAELAPRGATSVPVLSAATAAVVLLTGFALVQRRVTAPLVPFDLFASRHVLAGNLISLLVAAVIVGQSYFLSLYLRQILGYSPIRTGVALLPITLTVVAVSGLVPRVLPRVGSRGVLVASGLALAASMGLLARIDTGTGYWTLVPAFLAGGAGLAGTLVAGTVTATTGVTAARQGIASGVLNTTQQIGGALGLALLVSAAATRSTDAPGPPAQALTAGYRLAFAIAAGIAVVAALTSFLVPRRTSPHDRPATAEAPRRQTRATADASTRTVLGTASPSMPHPYPAGSPAGACVQSTPGRTRPR